MIKKKKKKKKEIKLNLHYDDVRGDFLRPPHGTKPAKEE